MKLPVLPYLVLIAVTIVCAARPVQTQLHRYAATNLGTLNGAANTSSFAWGINERGQMVGWSGFDTARPALFHAALWEDGAVRDLGTLPGRQQFQRGSRHQRSGADRRSVSAI